MAAPASNPTQTTRDTCLAIAWFPSLSIFFFLFQGVKRHLDAAGSCLCCRSPARSRPAPQTDWLVQREDSKVGSGAASGSAGDTIQFVGASSLRVELCEPSRSGLNSVGSKSWHVGGGASGTGLSADFCRPVMMGCPTLSPDYALALNS